MSWGLVKDPFTLWCWELSQLSPRVSPTPFFPSLKRGSSHGTFTTLWRKQVGGPGERADGLGIYPGSSLRHLPSSHLLPITFTYLEKIVLDLQHLRGQLSDAAECHSWDAVDNGQVNQSTEGIKGTGEGKKMKNES